jgi:predicted alpha/beta hydrolase family esterase
MPMQKLPFSSILVTSTTDQWVTEARARQFAEAWGSELISIGDAGHINADSGYGNWPAGLELLRKWT